MRRADSFASRISALALLGALGAGGGAMLAVQANANGVAEPQAHGWTAGLAAALGSALATVAIGFVLARRVHRVLADACAELDSIFPDDAAAPVDSVKGVPLPRLIDSIEALRERVKGQNGLEAQSAQRESREQARQDVLEQRITEFRAEVQQLISQTAEQLNNNQKHALEVREAAETVEVKAREAASASQKSSGEVEAVSSAADNVAMANGKIAERAERARSFANATREVSDRGQDQMRELQEQAARISNVVQIIRSIAQKTNLLALNASIEAARAGAAGRGFAVVASEVKALADQTAHATGEITEIIEGMQGSTDRAGVSFTEALQALTEIEELVSDIAEAITEQDQAVSDISFAIMGASSSAAVCAYDIRQLAEAATNASQGAESMNKISTTIFEASSALSARVASFLDAVSLDLQERRASMRVPVNEDVKVEVYGRPLPGKLVDISATGAQIYTDAELAPQTEVVLMRPNGQRAIGKVVWSNVRSYGVHFVEDRSEAVREALG